MATALDIAKRNPNAAPLPGREPAIEKAADLTVKSVSARNNNTADKYSLKGFGDALDRVQKECR